LLNADSLTIGAAKRSTINTASKLGSKCTQKIIGVQRY